MHFLVSHFRSSTQTRAAIFRVWCLPKRKSLCQLLPSDSDQAETHTSSTHIYSLPHVSMRSTFYVEKEYIRMTNSMELFCYKDFLGSHLFLLAYSVLVKSGNCFFFVEKSFLVKLGYFFLCILTTAFYDKFCFR